MKHGDVQCSSTLVVTLVHLLNEVQVEMKQDSGFAAKVNQNGCSCRL